MAITDLGSELIENGSILTEDLADGAATGVKLGSDVIVDNGAQDINGVKTFNDLPILVNQPTSANEAANKAYVDTLAEGFRDKVASNFATIADIAGTYSAVGGAGGTGNFTGVDLTDGTKFGINGGTIAVDDVLLIKNQVDAKQNGMYIVTVAGAAGEIERHPGMDGSPSSEVAGGNRTLVLDGTAGLKGSSWAILDAGEKALNTDDINWTQTNVGQVYAEGNGIDIVSNEISVQADAVGGANLATAIDVNVNGVAVKVDDQSIDQNGAGRLEVKDAGVTTAKLASTSVTAAKLGSDVAGSGLEGGNGSALAVKPSSTVVANEARVISSSANGLAVKVDDITIEENGSGQLGIKANSIGSDQVQDLPAGCFLFGDDSNVTVVAKRDILVITSSDFSGTTAGSTYTITGNAPLSTATEFEFFYRGLMLSQGASNDYEISGNTVTLRRSLANGKPVILKMVRNII